ncbi:hypothetical protein [Lentzea kentuckyensis]|nr:hypothetical protein [Lentzea kentuckyensis]
MVTGARPSSPPCSERLGPGLNHVAFAHLGPSTGLLVELVDLGKRA